MQGRESNRQPSDEYPDSLTAQPSDPHTHTHTQTADLVELVLLAELHALPPAVGALVQVGGDAAELDQLVLLQALGQADGVKVIVGIYGRPQALRTHTHTRV